MQVKVCIVDIIFFHFGTLSYILNVICLLDITGYGLAKVVIAYWTICTSQQDAEL